MTLYAKFENDVGVVGILLEVSPYQITATNEKEFVLRWQTERFGNVITNINIEKFREHIKDDPWIFFDGDIYKDIWYSDTSTPELFTSIDFNRLKNVVNVELDVTNKEDWYVRYRSHISSREGQLIRIDPEEEFINLYLKR